MKPKTIVLLSLLIAATSGGITTLVQHIRHAQNAPKQQGVAITRLNTDHLIAQNVLKNAPMPVYPWDKGSKSSLPPITKEHFRCKGSSLNTRQSRLEGDRQIEFYDCGGCASHSLPLKDGKEYIYPVLLELLNYIQTKTGKRVIITSGHRCPEHNTYVDSSKESRYSKHMIAAEVAFYVQGLEEKPQEVISLLENYYKNDPSMAFQRYKGDTNVSTPPWYNKEIFIKLYKKQEGRNFDNRHPYPYISIQVRWDRDTGEKVTYSWDKSYKNFLRY